MRLEVVHAWNLYGENTPTSQLQNQAYQALAKEQLEHAQKSIDRILKPFRLHHESDNVYLLHGTPDDAIPRFAEDRQTDLIVIGTVGRSGLKDVLIGNTAEDILKAVACSVLAVKPSKFESPVACG